MDEVYVFGLQRSGTTFLEKLLLQNFKCRQSSNYWKHSVERFETPALAFNIYKNPYTWIESIMFREHADLPISSPEILLPSYLNAGACTLTDDPVSINPVELAKLYERYSNNWYGYGWIVRYEDLIQEETLKQFIDSIHLPRVSEEIIIPEAGFFMSEGYTDDIVPYYLRGKPSRLTDRQVDAINRVISRETFDRLGYKKIP